MSQMRFNKQLHIHTRQCREASHRPLPKNPFLVCRKRQKLTACSSFFFFKNSTSICQQTARRKSGLSEISLYLDTEHRLDGKGKKGHMFLKIRTQICSHQRLPEASFSIQLHTELAKLLTHLIIIFFLGLWSLEWFCLPSCKK